MDRPPPFPDAAAALAAGDWRTAATLARREIAVSNDPRTHIVLAQSLWCGYEVHAAIDAMKVAYRQLVDADDVPRAAWMAGWIAFEESATRGNRAVASGWLGRAARLLEGCPEGAGHGWVLLHRAVWDGDHERLAQAGLDAERLARKYGDRNLELTARAERGHALVMLGRVDEGMALIDESMAVVTGGDPCDPTVAGDCFCVTITACESVQDYRRAEEWCRIGLAADETHPNGFLRANCLASYGWILGVLGRTAEGELRLREAMAMFDGGHTRMREGVVVRLADLHRRRGDRGGALRLLDEVQDSAPSLVIRGELALDGADPAGALRLAREVEALMRNERETRRIVSLQLKVRAAAGAGELGEAEKDLSELGRIADHVGTDAAHSWRAFAEAAVCAARDDTEGAVAADGAAARLFAITGATFEAAQARIHEAVVLDRAGRAGDAGAARAAAARILGAPVPAVAPSSRLTPRETEILRLVTEGLTNDAIAERLSLSPHTVHRHVASVLRKLDVPTRAAAAAEAIRSGMI